MPLRFCCHRRTPPSKPQWLRVSSVCKGACVQLAEPRERQPETWRQNDSWDGNHTDDATRAGWEGFCACCKRPLSIDIVDAPVDPASAAPLWPTAKRKKTQDAA